MTITQITTNHSENDDSSYQLPPASTVLPQELQIYPEHHRSTMQEP